MKTLLATLLLGSFISAPLFANEQANEYLEERSHNQHHNATSDTNVSSQGTMMQNHQQMMTQMHAMMADMHQMMSENGCANMMGNMEKTES